MTPLFVFDTETHLIRPGLLAPPLVCVSWYNALPIAVPSTGPLPTIEAGALDLAEMGTNIVAEKLLFSTDRIVGHNIAYDFGVLAARKPELLPMIFAAYDQGRVSDTGIREKLIKLALGDFSSDFASKKQKSFSMGDIFRIRFNQDLSADKSNPDAWRLRYAELDGVPLDQWPEEAKAYAIGDAEKTYLLWCAQASDTFSGVVDATTGLVTNEQEQAAAEFALHLMACWGVRTNHRTIEALATKLVESSRSVREALTGTVFRAKDGSKNVKTLETIVQQAYEGAGRDAPTTPTGKTKCSKDVLLAAPTVNQPQVCVWITDEVSGERELRDTPVLQALASISADEHNLTTYLQPLRGGVEVPITARWNVLVETGRTSCHSPINWTGIPKAGGYRECVEPRPGWVLIQADYSGIELVALAQHCLDMGWDSKLAEALIAGWDLHRALAADFLGISREEAEEHKKDPAVKIARDAAKQCNFGLGGGMGPAKFIETVRKQMSKAAFTAMFTDDPDEALRRAEDYKAKWLTRWSEMPLFFRDISMKCAAGGGEFTQVVTRSGRVRGGTGYCDGANGCFQSPVSDGMKAALFYVQMESYTGWSPLWTREDHNEPSPLLGTRMIIEVHDEFIAESPEEGAAEACERMCVVMVAGMKLYLPDVPVKVEPSMMRVWSKAAEEVRDEKGRLVCWEPAPVEVSK